MLEKHTLTGPNFNEWFRTLKLVVRTKKIHDVFETALPPRPVGVGDAPIHPQALAEWTAKYDRHNEVACLMLGSMTPRLYQQFEHKTHLEMYNELYQMHGKPPGVELQELIHLFHTCKQGDETSTLSKVTVGASSSTPQVMAIQGGRVQKKPHGKAKGNGKAKGSQYSYPSKTKKPQPQRKSVRQKKDSVTTARRWDIGSGIVRYI
nr:hypothetical protein [Tanacetum cinerariifolium]